MGEAPSASPATRPAIEHTRVGWLMIADGRRKPRAGVTTSSERAGAPSPAAARVSTAGSIESTRERQSASYSAGRARTIFCGSNPLVPVDVGH
uniref:Uncharacterized protein n=1 Tax=Plectus sambesii TaxID=2011161 RepID=A0A914WAV9_9BILA